MKRFRISTNCLLLLVVLLLYIQIAHAQNITGPSTVSAAVNQTGLNGSDIFRLSDANITTTEKRFLNFGRFENIPYLRQVNADRLRLIGANGAINAESFDNGNFKVRSTLISKFIIEQTGLWDAAFAASVSVTGGILFGGGPHLKLSNSYWNISALNQQIVFDLGQATALNYISFGSYYASDQRYIPRSYTVSHSADNSNYTDLITVTNNTNILQFHEFATTTARYWRIMVTEFQPGYSESKISGVQLLGAGAAATSGKFWSNKFGTSSIFFRGDAVGIGVVSVPTGYRLAVNGSALFTKVKVQNYTNWPDYVFDPGYRLPSLKEVEAYVNKNKHLPGMMSAKEVAKDGLDLADGQAALLKQVEEMMLHIIEQEKKIDKMAREIERLKELIR